MYDSYRETVANGYGAHIAGPACSPIPRVLVTDADKRREQDRSVSRLGKIPENEAPIDLRTTSRDTRS